MKKPRKHLTILLSLFYTSAITATALLAYAYFEKAFWFEETTEAVPGFYFIETPPVEEATPLAIDFLNEPPDNTIELEFPSQDETVLSSDEGPDIVTNEDHPLVMVNKDRKLPDDFEPRHLVEPDVHFSFNDAHERRNLRADAAIHLENLFDHALRDGKYLYAVSGYRSIERQTKIFDNNVAERGEEEATQVSASPGTSEHQTGLAMDISSQSNGFQLNQSFGETPEGEWVAEHAHLHGFVVRYPEGKQDITGYVYEPWHLRYVGVPYATYLFEHELTLEEAYN